MKTTDVAPMPFWTPATMIAITATHTIDQRDQHARHQVGLHAGVAGLQEVAEEEALRVVCPRPGRSRRRCSAPPRR